MKKGKYMPKRVINDNSYPDMMFIALKRLIKYPNLEKKEIINNFDEWWNLHLNRIHIYNIKVKV